jgi:hypothetical protein
MSPFGALTHFLRAVTMWLLAVVLVSGPAGMSGLVNARANDACDASSCPCEVQESTQVFRFARSDRASASVEGVANGCDEDCGGACPLGCSLCHGGGIVVADLGHRMVLEGATYLAMPTPRGPCGEPADASQRGIFRPPRDHV